MTYKTKNIKNFNIILKKFIDLHLIRTVIITLRILVIIYLHQVNGSINIEYSMFIFTFL
jgi:hypothetical protein